MMYRTEAYVSRRPPQFLRLGFLEFVMLFNKIIIDRWQLNFYLC